MGSPLRSFMRKMEWLILVVLAGVDRTSSSLQRTLPLLYGRNIADTGPPAHVAALQILGISGAILPTMDCLFRLGILKLTCGSCPQFSAAYGLDNIVIYDDLVSDKDSMSNFK